MFKRGNVVKLLLVVVVVSLLTSSMFYIRVCSVTDVASVWRTEYTEETLKLSVSLMSLSQ